MTHGYILTPIQADHFFKPDFKDIIEKTCVPLDSAQPGDIIGLYISIRKTSSYGCEKGSYIHALIMDENKKPKYRHGYKAIDDAIKPAFAHAYTTIFDYAFFFNGLDRYTSGMSNDQDEHSLVALAMPGVILVMDEESQRLSDDIEDEIFDQDTIDNYFVVLVEGAKTAHEKMQFIEKNKSALDFISKTVNESFASCHDEDKTDIPPIHITFK